MQKQRNSKGQFVKDHVNLTNDFKGLEVNQDRPIKQVPTAQIVIAMIVVFLGLLLLDWLGVIQLVYNGEL